ncbi:MAG: hypothetical protein O6831_01290 [Alphaproteobacteria bacterium]|nr:hypothetical protein [Alphaproteobacteria bacterium]
MDRLPEENAKYGRSWPIENYFSIVVHPGPVTKTKRKAIKVGTTRTFTTASAGSTAKKIDCKG